MCVPLYKDGGSRKKVGTLKQARLYFHSGKLLFQGHIRRLRNSASSSSTTTCLLEEKIWEQIIIPPGIFRIFFVRPVI